MDGVVKSSDPISKGNEAKAGGNEKTAGGTKVTASGTFEWPVKKHSTPQERGHEITSIKADRNSPGGFGSTHHQGMDIAANTGDEIVATAAGIVTVAEAYGGYGNAVVLELDAPINGKKATVTYGHNSEIVVKRGDHVTAGQVIAKAGSTGWSTGPHCHFQVNLEGEDEAIDPLHLFTEAQVNSDSCYADNNSPAYGPVKGDGLYCSSGGRATPSSSVSTTSTSNSSSSGSSSSGERDIVAAAQDVHKIIENGYTYGSNPSATVDESEQKGIKRVDCTTYVDWVLNRIGLDVQTRYAESMKEEFEAADWAEAVSQEDVEAGDIVLFHGHGQIYGGKNDSGEDTWFNAGNVEVIRAPAPSAGLSSTWDRGPIGIYRIVGATHYSGNSKQVKTPTGTPGSGWVDLKGSSSNQDAKITIEENKNIKEDEENRFQGSVKVRRLTPKKTIGAYEGGEDVKKTNDEVYNYVPEIPGMGKAISLSDAMKGSLKTASLSGKVTSNINNLVYLTIPYYDFDLKLHEGHMIVNKSLAQDVLNIFYELYDKKYPMESIEIADNFLDNFDSNKFFADAAKQEENVKKQKEAKEKEQKAKNKLKNSNSSSNNVTNQNETKLELENEGKPSFDRTKIRTTSNRNELGQMSADSNNTCCLYYDSSNGSAHMTGNAIDINPRYNPKTNNKTTTDTYNAQYYVDRENRGAWSEEAERAFIDEESVVYKVFESYGWTWGGTEGDYGHFEKTEIDTEDAEEEEPVYIESTYYDLSYVDEATFNSYIQTGDKRALYVYTLNSTRDIITGAWSYDQSNSKAGKEFTISKVPVGYRKALNKYTMPVELLLAVLMHSKDAQFTDNMAKLGIESQYVVTIKDSVSTTKTTTTTTKTTTKYDEEGKEVEGGEDVEEVVNENITETSTQKPEVTYIDNWFVRYVNLFPGATEELITYDANLGNGADVDVLGTRTPKTSNSTSSITTSTIDDEPTKELPSAPPDPTKPAITIPTPGSGTGGNSEQSIVPYDPNANYTPVDPNKKVDLNPFTNGTFPTNGIPPQNLLGSLPKLKAREKYSKWESSSAIRIAMEKRRNFITEKSKEILTNVEISSNPTEEIIKAGAPYADPERRKQEEEQKAAEEAATQSAITEAGGQAAPEKQSTQENGGTAKEGDAGFVGPPTPENIVRKKKTGGKASTETTTTSESEAESLTYNYSETTGVAYENHQRFVQMFQESGLKSNSNTYVGWINDSIEKNVKTANLVEVMQYLLSKVMTEYYSMSEISFMDDYRPDEFGFVAGEGGESTVPGMIDLKKPVLTREQFIQALEAYKPKANESFATNFAANAGQIYDTAVEAGVNPELVVVTAKQEQNFVAGGGTHNYWGIGVFNGSNTGRGFATIFEGIKAYAKVLESYEEGGEYAAEITQLAQERQAAGCDPTGYGPPGTMQGMQSVYSSLGAHIYGSSGAGGYYYMDPDRSGCTKIYKTHEEFVTKCQNAGGEHAAGQPVTAYEGGQFTAYQVEMKIDFWKEIFGAFGSL